MRIVPRMNVLLVQPLAPKTYWGFQYAVGIVGKAAPHPPPGLATLPPRFDLLDRSRYTSMSVQSSRGCPFQCEFCDIIELYGRNPRVKSPAQMLHELDALYELGWRGSIFVVDDNFIGNRRETAKLLPEIARWQREHGRPFELYTDSSVDLASLPALVDSMLEAGFTTVFLGIETPSAESLKQTRKLQNLKLPLQESVLRLTHAGLEVYAGFIVGFDTDGEHIFEAQRTFIDGLPIAAAMIGLLTALPNTALWRRLEREGRLRSDGTGDQFGRPNFEPVLDERALLEGYRDLLGDIYQPEAFYARCERLVREVGRGRPRRFSLDALPVLFRVLVGMGLLSPRRFLFWRLFFKAARRPRPFARPMSIAVQGTHRIRSTRKA